LQVHVPRRGYATCGRAFAATFAGHFPSGLDHGSPIGESGRLSVEVAAVRPRIVGPS
jgi:hypothetical protein